MKTQGKSNVGHSVYERLRNYAFKSGSDFQYALTRYANERFLYRLSISEHRPKLILKGASMLLVWAGDNYRVTRDTDFLGLMNENADEIKAVLAELCKLNTYETDGIRFLPDSIKTTEIREKRNFGGVRANITC